MITQNQNHTIDEILGDFGIYLYPDILKDELKNSLDVSKLNIKNLEKYNHLLISVNYAWQKVLRYEVYFQDFYSNSEKIDKTEELNHHIHAYLQDMDTLKNKIENLFFELKKDIKKIAINKGEIEGFFQAGLDKTKEVFNRVIKHRIQHVHRNFQFMDGDLMKAENAQRVIDILNNPVLATVINQEYKPTAVAKLEKDKMESFDVAKTRWVKTAKNNSQQTSGFLDSILGVIKPSLYQFLDIKPTKDILGSVSNK